MIKKYAWLLAIAGVLGLVSVVSAATSLVYLPMVIQAPTPTETLTPTVTSTPTPTATVTPTPTITLIVSLTPTPTATRTSGVIISAIEGNPLDEVNGEFIEIYNLGTRDVDMTDWWIKTDGYGLRYTFPDNFILDGGSKVKVWTRVGSDDSRNLYWDRTEEAWKDASDCGYLRDSNGTLVHTYCYGK